MDSSGLLTHSLHASSSGAAVQRILSAALQAVEPAAAVHRRMKRSGDRLQIGDYVYDLRRIGDIFIVGAGKAAAPMAQAVIETLGERVSGGVVLVKEGYASEAAARLPVELIEAGHPIPDERGERGSARIIHLLQKTQANDLVIVLVSGGASAIMISPAPGIALADLQSLTSLLLSSGASVNEINCLRKHLEQLKGGNLARLASPARVAALILSDVVGDPLDSIGSGPTAPDLSTFADAYEVLKRYGLLQQSPKPILDHLHQGLIGEWPDTPKVGDPLFDQVINVLVGSNTFATEAAMRQARVEGFNSLLLTTYLQGEARQAGRFLAAIARQIDRDGHPLSRPACLVTGGETTVTVRGGGLGGRNQELALGAVLDLFGLHAVALVTLATDGGDGFTPAAGAVVTGDTLPRARQLGMDPNDYLQRNDAYHFFEPLDDLLLPGPTLTNVNDLAFLFAFE